MTTSDIPKILADAAGVDESTVLALMATAINGLIGRRNTLGDHAGTLQVPPMGVALVGADGAAPDLVNRLLEPARVYQKQLNARFRETDVRLIEDLLRGREGSTSRMEAQQALHTAIYGQGNQADRVEHNLVMEHTGRMIDFDLKAKGLVDRLDLILRPGFLIESPSVSTLKKDLQCLHMGSGLISGGAGFRVDHLKKAAIEMFGRCVSSERQPIPEILTGGRKGLTEQPHVSWILHFALESMEMLEIRNLVRDALLMDGGVGAERPIPPLQLTKTAFHAWTNTVGMVLRIRRTGEGYEHCLITDAEVVEFEERYRDYRHECNESGLVSRAIVQLPRLLLCTPLMIQLQNRSRPSVEHWFHHAEVLRERHQRLLQQVNCRSQADETIRLAERILQRIKLRAPLSLRDLLRSFDKQAAELYVPTLELMLLAGIIEEPAAKTYIPGKVQNLDGGLRPLLAQQQLKVVA